MKERLFRAKKIKDGEWVVGYLFCISTHYRILLPESFEESDYQPYLGYVIDPATIGQDTGMVDKTGKRIFEGDIVRGIGVVGEEVIEPVEYIGFEYLPFDYIHVNETEILGNIHDNPELLRAKKEEQA